MRSYAATVNIVIVYVMTLPDMCGICVLNGVPSVLNSNISDVDQWIILFYCCILIIVFYSCVGIKYWWPQFQLPWWRRGGSRPAGHGRKCGSRRWLQWGAAEPSSAWGDSDYNAALDEVFSDSSSDNEVLKKIFRRRRRNRKLLKLAFFAGTYHDTYLDKQPRRDPIESGID